MSFPINTLPSVYPVPTVNLLASAVLILASCDARCQKLDTSFSTTEEPVPYVLDRPTYSVKLPDDLTEVSGLSALDSARVVAIQDEDGVVFVLDASSGALVSEHRFGDEGDYEGIEAVGDLLYVLRSDGTLFELRDWSRERVGTTIRHETWLSSRNDTEGLALDPDGLHLLVACKEYPGKGLKGKRSVYRYSLAAGDMAREPALILDARAAEGNLAEGAVSRAIRRLLDIRRFKPSGLAVHPLTGEVYIVSSVSRSLTVFDQEGRLRSIVRLDKNLLPQPEGITFLPNGDLLLSSEGDGGRARLTRFRYFPPE